MALNQIQNEQRKVVLIMAQVKSQVISFLSRQVIVTELH